jgi:hypothetical protein
MGWQPVDVMAELTHGMAHWGRPFVASGGIRNVMFMLREGDLVLTQYRRGQIIQLEVLEFSW